MSIENLSRWREAAADLPEEQAGYLARMEHKLIADGFDAGEVAATLLACALDFATNPDLQSGHVA